MDLRELSDRAEITELTGGWTDAVNLRDFDRFRACWTVDAVWTISAPVPMRVDGAGAIVAKLRELLALETAFFQALHTGTISVTGDVATARWGVTEFGKPDTPGQGYFNHAVYLDRLRRDDGRWRFLRRDYRYVYVDRSLLRGDWYPVDMGEVRSMLADAGGAAAVAADTVEEADLESFPANDPPARGGLGAA